MKKYLIKSKEEYDCYTQWTVFALSEDSAKTTVKMFGQNYLGEDLVVISEKSAKGRKDAGILKYSVHTIYKHY